MDDCCVGAGPDEGSIPAFCNALAPASEITPPIRPAAAILPKPELLLAGLGVGEGLAEAFVDLLFVLGF